MNDSYNEATSEEVLAMLEAPLTAEERARYSSIEVGTAIHEISICRNLIEKHPNEPRWEVMLARLLETEAILQNNPMGRLSNG